MEMRSLLLLLCLLLALCGAACAAPAEGAP